MRIGALLLGLLFGFGLLLSGMANPAKVQGFLDWFGGWDATLAFVMGGAVALTLPLFQWAAKRPQPLLAGSWYAPAMQGIDRRLILGSALFGIGWGLAGICPGPALVLLGLGHWDTLVFLVAMVAGMGGWQYWQRRVN
jgi:uncharacterized membrane protein YedE/YeeE